MLDLRYISIVNVSSLAVKDWISCSFSVHHLFCLVRRVLCTFCQASCHSYLVGLDEGFLGQPDVLCYQTSLGGFCSLSWPNQPYACPVPHPISHYSALHACLYPQAKRSCHSWGSHWEPHLVTRSLVRKFFTRGIWRVTNLSLMSAGVLVSLGICLFLMASTTECRCFLPGGVAFPEKRCSPSPPLYMTLLQGAWIHSELQCRCYTGSAQLRPMLFLRGVFQSCYRSQGGSLFSMLPVSGYRICCFFLLTTEMEWLNRPGCSHVTIPNGKCGHSWDHWQVPNGRPSKKTTT